MPLVQSATTTSITYTVHYYYCWLPFFFPRDTARFLQSVFQNYMMIKFIAFITFQTFNFKHSNTTLSYHQKNSLYPLYLKNCVFLLQNYNAWLEFKAGGSCLYSNNNDAGRLFNSREESLYNSTGH